MRQPWSGLIHAGGVLADALVPKQSAASLRIAFGPKVLPLTHAINIIGSCRLEEAVLLWLTLDDSDSRVCSTAFLILKTEVKRVSGSVKPPHLVWAQVHGLTNIIAALQAAPLQRMHVFSSISADVGNAGQSNYAPANAAMNAMTLSLAHKVSL